MHRFVSTLIVGISGDSLICYTDFHVKDKLEYLRWIWQPELRKKKGSSIWTGRVSKCTALFLSA